MSRTNSVIKLSRQITQLKVGRTQPLFSNFCTMLHSPIHNQTEEDNTKIPRNTSLNKLASPFEIKDALTPRPRPRPRPIGENITRKDKITVLVITLMDLDDSKEAIYNTLDAWVAWERDFPIGALKNVLLALEKEQQWHRIIQVIKWMLSKGQGNTRGTYGQLIQALDKDRRVEEANEIWNKKLGFDLHSVPWKLCKLMISVYHRNNMFEDVVKLFKGLEGFDRKPPEKSIVQKVADACEILGKSEEKERILEKYKDLFVEMNVKSKRISLTRSPKKGKPSKKG